MSLALPDDADVTAVVAHAMTAARLAQVRWARTSLPHRLGLIRMLRQLIAEQAESLATISASARQRPAMESLTAEVLPLAEACRFLEREATALLATKRLGTAGRPLWLQTKRTEVRREPFGIILVIGPGNYPLLLPGVQLVQALVAGNAVVLKPGAGGSAAARALVELCGRAGFDRHLLAVLPETTEAARAAIAARPDKVLFTGSAATGEKIQAQLAPLLIPATMELSGCDAVIVRADADLDLTVRALTFGLQLNGGATCMAPKRVFVAAGRATDLEGRLTLAFRKSPERKPTTSHDPQLRAAINDALARGAHFVAGEILPDGAIALPVLLSGVAPHSQILREDLFAPVLSIVTVADDHEALLRTNDCPFALTASIFSRDESAAHALAQRIQAGVITVNDLILPTADARLPFGGRGRSGFGTTRGAAGLLELTTPKVITMTSSSFRPAFDSPEAGDAAMFQAYLQLTHGRGWRVRWQALVHLIQSLARRKNHLPRN